eukprot:1119015-Pelagomonas_calceolata.AAC.1
MFCQNSPVAPYIARLFAAMMERAEISACWKAAKITPLYKKGSVLDPGNYRMLRQNFPGTFADRLKRLKCV